MSKKKMFWTKLKRILRTGFFNFWRDGTVTLASVLVMTVTLLIIGLISFSSAILDTTLAELKNKIDINVTFITSANEEDILNIKHTIESLPEVLLVTYMSREEAITLFKERHAGDQSILSALDELGENPLGGVLNVKARDPSQYASVAKFLESGNVLSSGGITIIDRVNYFQNKVAIDKLTMIIASADRLGFALALFFAIISVLIAFNTIRLTIYLARDEISVMRLVGASTTYIRGPFVVVGIIYGVVSGLLTLLFLLPLTYWLGGTTESFFVGFNIFSYYLRHFLEITFIIMVSGVFIGALSSTLAIRKYLKV
ncbi:MAG: permease-like cell division protein FtsX [bacterium]|nr:permease-like cell division protein FtsX [bacterium]MDZ4205656.1 permease-like cell division protein FtsX [Patescibacteria group bacterium]